MKRVSTFDVLGVEVSAVAPETAFAVIRDLVASREKAYVCVAPVSTVVDARRDPAYRDVVNNAAMVTPDGMPLVWLGRRRAGKHVRRVYGPDLMLRVCDQGRRYGFRHYFYGSTPEVCDKLEHVLTERFPGLQVVGTMAPPYRKEVMPALESVRSAINAARPDIIWVGLGSPKQDRWMAINRDGFDAPVMIGIGAAFDFHAGVKPQAPGWMRQAGLEWLFRLCCEPRRLWRRYLVGNALFLLWLARESLVARNMKESRSS